MLAQGLIFAAEIALNEEAESIEVVVPTKGFEKYLIDFVPSWRCKLDKDPSFTRNNIPVWEKLHALYLLGGLKIRLPKPNERIVMKGVKAAAREAAFKAEADFKREPGRYAVASVFVIEDERK